ncbi:tetratricopeptide repeat protein [Sulfurospirillum sp.]|uniref:tetratricopeptide repeat protein n=1 Tax=Sulfurospirillum sp. TaxID=2053622 RepID=UPI002FDD773E
MKYFLIFLLASVQLSALEIILNSGKESKVNYAILHVIDAKPFGCQTIPDALDKKHYICKISRPMNKPIESKKMKLAELDFYEKDGEFYVTVEPKVDSKLIPVEESLYLNSEILTKPQEKRYTHWTILLQEKPLYEEKDVRDGLDFSVEFPKYQKPYIGALDLNGAPISYAQSKDIPLYLDIKQEYESGYYDSVVKDVKRVLTLFPNSIFRSELDLYHMRAMDKILTTKGEDGAENMGFNDSDIINVGKRWTKEFASDENIPEVLMMMTKAYIKTGSKSDANYFIDILVNEHPDSLFTKRAILLYADNLFLKKEKDKAMKLYLDVLYSAQDLDIASEAAIRLSDHQMDAGKMKEAKEYLLKVLNVNAQFLLKDKDASYKLARRLFEHKLYDLAAKITDLLLEKTPKKGENRELLLKESGDWHAKANEVEAAHARYQEYLADYKNSGDYVQEVTESLDELFFKLNENNETKLANYYDKLIENYNNEIGQKALLEKAKLLLKQQRFEEVLALQNELGKVPDRYEIKPEELIYGAAKSLALQKLQKDECQTVVGLIEEYKLQINESEYEEKLYKCFVRVSRFDRAQEISSPHLKDISLQSRYAWAQKEVQVLYMMGKYKEVIGFKEDLKTLSFSLREKIGLETIRDLFFSFIKLKNSEGATSLAESIKILYPDEASNLDIYYEIVKMAGDTKNDLLLVTYAQASIEMQKKFKSSALTPVVEFSYIDALKRLERDAEALKIAESLMPINLGNKDKIRLFYQAGELSLKLKENAKAKEYFTQCVAIQDNSSWKNICQQNLDLLL